MCVQIQIRMTMQDKLTFWLVHLVHANTVHCTDNFSTPNSACVVSITTCTSGGKHRGPWHKQGGHNNTRTKYGGGQEWSGMEIYLLLTHTTPHYHEAYQNGKGAQDNRCHSQHNFKP